MDYDLGSALKFAGYISRDQLERIFELDPSNIVWEPWMLWERSGLWDRERYRRRAKLRHWTLRTETFLALAPYLTEWTIDGLENGGVVPDAIMKTSGPDSAIALEADTGKETAAQWRVKLEGYQTDDVHGNLVVVAEGGPLRLGRLTEWLSQWSPLPWQLIPASRLWQQRGDWVWHSPQVSVTGPRPSAVGLPRPELYLLDGVVIAKTEAASLIDQRQIQVASRERRHHTDVYHLIRR
ncbi:MAG: replication-relaxation family protein [Thermaerobacter sp.]|nr:replication-relaxation family protein [Thermaerobacter sp.]